MANHQVSPNLAWPAQIRQIVLGLNSGCRDLTPEKEERVLEVLFELLDRFLAEDGRSAERS